MCVRVCVYTKSAVASCLAVGGAGAAVGVTAGGAGGMASCRSAVRGWEGRGLVAATAPEWFILFMTSTQLHILHTSNHVKKTTGQRG